MAYDRTGVWKFLAELTTGNFDEENAGAARAPMRVWGTAPDIQRTYFESPESSQGIYRHRALLGRSTGEISLTKWIRPKGTGTALKANTFLLPLFGAAKNLSAVTCAVANLAGTGDTSTTSCQVPNATFAAADIGAMIAIPCIDGKWYVRELRTIVDDAGPDAITWCPALPAKALAAAALRGCITYYFTGSVGAAATSLQCEIQHEDTNHRILYLGCGVDGKIKFEPLSEMPFPTLEMAIKCAQSSWIAGGAAITDAADDNAEPLALDPMEFLVGTYTALVRDTTRIEAALNSFVFDMGHNLQAVPDGNSAVNAVARWKNTKGNNTLQGVAQVGWSKDLWLYLEQGIRYQIFAGWGSTLAGGVGGLYIPCARWHDVKPIDVENLGLAELTFGADTIVDAATANAVESAVVKLGVVDI